MTRQIPARALAIGAATALAVAACGGTTASTTPTQPPATVAPATSQAPSSGLPGFSFELPSVDKELEGLLPDDIGGEPVTKASVTGDTLLQSGSGGDEFQKVLTALGKAPSDLTAALGGNSKAFVIAFKIKDVPASQFFDQFVQLANQGSASQLSDVTLGGKQVKKFTDTAGTTTYLYLVGDTIITVSPIVPDDAVLNEIFQKLG
ncbi:MAG TPA: hypothetical protein VFP56_11415 [Candidatus Limnocylindrales bacterium]|nr:hypothetical protein [Candidatus Limnocylindrales bacterium]